MMPNSRPVKLKPAALLLAGSACLNRVLSRMLQWLVRLYQLTLSPFIGNQCRFHPTCSHYAMEALQRHGPWRGSWLAATRLGRCHPLAAGGVDLVPTTNPACGMPPGQPHVKEAL